MRNAPIKFGVPKKVVHVDEEERGFVGGGSRVRVGPLIVNMRKILIQIVCT